MEDIKVSDSFTKSVFSKISRLKSLTSIAINCGSYSCTSAELRLAEQSLKASGFSFSYGTNSHNVKTLIIKL
jgi:hypothetical protein